MSRALITISSSQPRADQFVEIRALQGNSTPALKISKAFLLSTGAFLSELGWVSTLIIWKGEDGFRAY